MVPQQAKGPDTRSPRDCVGGGPPA